MNLQRVATSSVLILAVLTVFPGCVVKKIYRELEEANVRIAEVEAELQSVERTNELLEQLRIERLQILEPINESLLALRDQLKAMESIDASLKKLDNHLASLRRTIENIDSTIPFLRIADPSEDEPAEESSDPGEAAPEQGGPAQNPGDGSADAPEGAEESPAP